MSTVRSTFSTTFGNPGKANGNETETAVRRVKNSPSSFLQSKISFNLQNMRSDSNSYFSSSADGNKTPKVSSIIVDEHGEKAKITNRRRSSVKNISSLTERPPCHKIVAAVISRILFPGLPEYYPFHKKLLISRTNSVTGIVWDVIQILSTGTICTVYVLSTYPLPTFMYQNIIQIEIILTQLFMVDFLLNLYLFFSLAYIVNWETWIALISLLPVYLSFGIQIRSTSLDFLRCLRIMNLLRLFRSFKPLKGISGVRRQVMTLVLTLFSMIFLAAGVVQLMENNVHQYDLQCQYINEKTEWQPSCSPLEYIEENCDCSTNLCRSMYKWGDEKNHPSGIYCSVLTYYDAFYFMIVTVATVGYGEITPSNIYTKIVIIIFIVTSLIIVIPRHVNELQVLLSLRSPYRQAYVPGPGESHVILCGHVNNRMKLESFFEEFFHSDRVSKSGLEYHAVILCPSEPSEEVRSLLQSPTLDSKVSYVMGSALSVEDLKHVRADIAACMFFICNTNLAGQRMSEEDTATVIRALSVSNFNPSLECLVQVLRPEERVILKGSDVDIILCMDEFKTALQARNSICPGFSTFVENIFHSLKSIPDSFQQKMSPWYQEYLSGASMELYLLPLNPIFVATMRYNFFRITEGLFLHFGVVILGLTNKQQNGLVFNPCSRDIREFKNVKHFFESFNVAVIIASDQHEADKIAEALGNPDCINDIINDLNDGDPVPSDVQQRRISKAPRLLRDIRKGSSQAASMSNVLKSTLGIKHRTSVQYSELYISNGGAEFSPSDSDSDETDDERDYIGFGTISMLINRFYLLFHILTSEYIHPYHEASSRDKARAEFNGRSGSSENLSNGNIIAPGFSPKSSMMKTSGNASGNLRVQGSPKSTKIKFIDHKGSNVALPSKPQGESISSKIKSLPPLKEKSLRNQLNNRDISESRISEDMTGCLKGPPMQVLSAIPGTPKKRLLSKARSSNVIDTDDRSPPESLVLATSQTQLLVLPNLEVPKPLSFVFNAKNIGSQSMILDSARASGLRNHVIFTGSQINIEMFISELRRPAVKGQSYHPILLVFDQTPLRWDRIAAKYNDVYFMSGVLTRKASFVAANIKHAFSLIFLMERIDVSKEDTEERSADAATLFSYLKLEAFIPNTVFCSVELSNASNMAVLNSTIMKRNRQKYLESEKNKLIANKRMNETMGFNGYSGISDADSIKYIGIEEEEAALAVETARIAAEKSLWEEIYSHHILPVFASARSFVPSSFESLLVQSFFAKLTPVICEKFVCGQLNQTVMLVSISPNLFGSDYTKLFRIFIRHKVLCFGLYRSPQRSLGAALPYVYTSPPGSTILGNGDKVYCFGSSKHLERALKTCNSL